jgi:hypothetical protein
MEPRNQEPAVLRRALDAAKRAADLTATILPWPTKQHTPFADALLEFQLDGRKERFLAEIKTIDRRIAVAQVKEQLQALIDEQFPGYRPLLITAFATTNLAEECRNLGLAFIDTAGNLFLRTNNYIADIRGKARPDHMVKIAYRANKPAGMKVTFALLCKPELANATYREIAKFARVALGVVGPVLDDLVQRGYLGKRKEGNTLARPRELLNEWVTYYPGNLRPTLRPQRYQADRDLITQVDLAPFGAYWGGEYGAEQLTRYLKAEYFTIYVQDAPPAALMTKARMRLAIDGNTEILQAFWHPELVKPVRNTAPPMLIYADLMATTDSRNLETAKELYAQFLESAIHQP